MEERKVCRCLCHKNGNVEPCYFCEPKSHEPAQQPTPPDPDAVLDAALVLVGELENRRVLKSASYYTADSQIGKAIGAIQAAAKLREPVITQTIGDFAEQAGRRQKERNELLSNEQLFDRCGLLHQNEGGTKFTWPEWVTGFYRGYFGWTQAERALIDAVLEIKRWRLENVHPELGRLADAVREQRKATSQ